VCVERPGGARGERQGRRDPAEIRALDAVERDDRQPRLPRGRDLGLTGEPAKHHDVDIRGARQAGETQLPVELDGVLVLARDHERAQILVAHVGGDPLRHHRVAGDHPQDRPVVPGRVVLAARLVVARHAGPRGHRRDASTASATSRDRTAAEWTSIS
jgi:hypothetical protein